MGKPYQTIQKPRPIITKPLPHCEPKMHRWTTAGKRDGQHHVPNRGGWNRASNQILVRLWCPPTTSTWLGSCRLRTLAVVSLITAQVIDVGQPQRFTINARKNTQSWTVTFLRNTHLRGAFSCSIAGEFVVLRLQWFFKEPARTPHPLISHIRLYDKLFNQGMHQRNCWFWLILHGSICDHCSVLFGTNNSGML